MFCSQGEIHLFVHCPRLLPLFELLTAWLRGLWEGFSLTLFLENRLLCKKENCTGCVLQRLDFTFLMFLLFVTRRDRCCSYGVV